MWYNNEDDFKATNGYVIDGTWYPRVTKILEVKSKPGLEVFFKEMDSYTSVEKVKTQSALEGSMVHSAIQGLLTGKNVTIPVEITPAIEAFQCFNQKRAIVFHKEYVERQVKSSHHRYAGTIDALATIDGKFGVLDIKTSTGFYPEYNLQTAAYVLALQEFSIKRELALPRDIQTRWILRIDQHRICKNCGAVLREKGGRKKIREKNNIVSCSNERMHQWGDLVGDIGLKEFPYMHSDIKAFIAAKVLWEWEHNFWLRRIGYTKI